MKRDFALVAKAVIIRNNQFLLLKRSKKEIESSVINRYQAWDLPGGGIRFFETAEKGLYREIKEETSLSVALLRPIGMYDAIRSQIHLSIVTYLCEYLSGEVILSSEHASFHWLFLDEMEEANVPKWMIRDCEIAEKEYQFWKKEK